MNFDQIFKNILNDVKVKLDGEFDKNFERKAFFNTKWPTSDFYNRKGSMMNRSGTLRRSINSQIVGKNQIKFSSSLPYASLHNEGGEMEVTAKMKKFFWAMYYKSSGAVSTKKDGTASHSQRNKKLSLEAEQYKALALMKVGTKMKIKQRQFIGDHPSIRPMIEKIVQDEMKHLNLNPNKK